MDNAPRKQQLAAKRKVQEGAALYGSQPVALIRLSVVHVKRLYSAKHRGSRGSKHLFKTGTKHCVYRLAERAARNIEQHRIN